MLTIQPNFTNYRTKVSFGMDMDEVEENKNFYRDSVEQIDEFLSSDYVPEGVKKPFKFFRVIGNAAFQGLAVFGSMLGIANFFKKGKAKVDSYKFVQNAKTRVDNLNLGKKLDNLIASVKKTKYYQDFRANSVGSKIIKGVKTAKEYASKPFQNVNYDKATKATAAVLGTGSGLAGGYEEYIKENPVLSEEAA